MRADWGGGRPCSPFLQSNFYTSQATDSAKADLKKNIILRGEIDQIHFEHAYGAALRSISAGRDFSALFNALMQMNLKGMTKRKAVEIALLLNDKATGTAAGTLLESAFTVLIGRSFEMPELGSYEVKFVFSNNEAFATLL